MEKIFTTWILGLAATIALTFAIAFVLFVIAHIEVGALLLGIVFIPLLLGWVVNKWEDKLKS